MVPTRVELATLALLAPRSNRLSYRTQLVENVKLSMLYNAKYTRCFAISLLLSSFRGGGLEVTVMGTSQRIC